jgi:8-oxo-dGTP diphosphatase
MSFRLAAYAVCIQDSQVLLARWVSPTGESSWTLPGGGVEHGEDPFDTVVREVAEETGCDAVVDRLLGVDSRIIPAAERTLARPAPAPECRHLLPGPHHWRPAPA